MTRFARSKGSKASNERVPDESTPWHVMKQQLEDSTAKKQSTQEHKTKSAKELLRERDEPYYGDIGNQNNDWAEFEPEKKETPKEKKKTSNKLNSDVNEKSKKQKTPNETDVEIKHNTDNPENTLPPKKAKKRKSDIPNGDKNLAPEVDKTAEKIESERPNKKAKKEKEKTNELPMTDGSSMKLSKRQKRNRKNKLKQADDQNVSAEKEKTKQKPGAFNIEGNEWASEVKFGKKNKTHNQEDKSNNINNENPTMLTENESNRPMSQFNSRPNGFERPNNRFSKQKVVKQRKPSKIRDDKEHKRRKPNPGVQKVIINGIEVDIVLYDGFPVKKDDADRLIELRKQMVMKGIPKSEINAAMKLERRKAEKNLTRIKKNVCFHCRKAGHNLSDCPELGQEEKATGICFKCGSGEHTHFECKVTKKEDFGFAKCFICREQGHIAKQCPDNPKGLYPQGGACKICGDVTHLKKDCPDLAKEKEETTLTVDTISSSIDALESEKKADNHSNKSKQKVVTF